MVKRVGPPDGNDPAVAADVLGPLEQPLVGLVLVVREPAHEHRRETAVREVRRGAAHDPLRDLVRAEPAIAVRPPVFRRDDVRRVARDEVERLVAGRLEQAAEPALDVPHSVQSRIQGGVREGAWIDVGRDDVLRMTRREEGLHTASRPHVERAFHPPAGGQRCEELRCRRIGDDVVRRILPVTRIVVGRDEQRADRQDTHARDELVSHIGDPGRRQGIDRRPPESADEVAGR